MSQQANNKKNLRYFATHNCRICFCLKKNKSNFDFDTINNNKTYLHTLFF